ncbi:MAG: ABC transporter permease [Fimbriimonadaceae bacterium]|nr:ABC transporter permease [Fimbriimonadaceae bacterium]
MSQRPTAARQRRLGRQIATRLGWGALTLLGTAALLLLLLHLSGDPAKAYAGEKADEATVARIRVQMGFDRPLAVQYLRYVGRALRGDLGRSTLYDQPVAKLLWQRLPATALLAAAGLAFWVLVGVPVGIYTAVHQGRAADRLGLVVAVLSYSIPTFWLGRLLQHELAWRLPWFPVGGYGSLAHLVLPGLTLGLAGVGYYMRLVHTSMLEVLPAEYIRTARAKGLSEWAVLWHHGFRNAMLPVVTVLGLDTARLLGGVVFTEAVFAWPGIGSQAVQAIFNLDQPLVMGTVLLTAALVVAANLVVDVLYYVLDPRIRDGEERH